MPPSLVRGLCARDGSALLASGGAGRVKLASVNSQAGHPGTYHYWATAIGAPVPFREMAGAFVVDPLGGSRRTDRVLVITEWTQSLAGAARRGHARRRRPAKLFVKMQPRVAFMMNGLSWPATERLTYRARRAECGGASST